MTRMTDDQEFKANVRKMWAMADYGTFAQLVWEVGPRVVEVANPRAGSRLLDVAAGTGNVAIRAAQAGASVVALDLTPEHFEAGRQNAAEAGVEVEWVEGDAEALPFEDASFDLVTSSFGAIFAPRHQTVADEMLRVCKPGGRIAMANFKHDGLLRDFFGVFVPYMPPPRDGDLPPTLWGDPEHVRSLFGDRISNLDIRETSYVERAETPRGYCDFFKKTFGPVAATYEGLRNDPRKTEALDRAFLDFAESFNSGATGGPAEYRYEYLLVTADKR